MFTGDAFNDIIMSDMFQANIESISFIVQFVDGIFTRYITFIAFLIISLALLRNVLTGLYCTFPRLFDWIAEKKAAVQNKGSGSTFGIFFSILAFFIPNIRPLCITERDGEDHNIHAGYYFTKALWEGTVAIVVGTVIYNGYYREILSIGSRIGAHVLKNYVLVVDYAKLIDDAVNTGQQYTFSYNDKTAGGKERNALNKAVYDAVMNYYDNEIRDTNTRAVVGQNVERIVEQYMRAAAVQPAVANATDFWSLMGHDEFRMSQQVSVVPNQPNNMTMDNLDPSWRVVQFSFPVSDINVSTPRTPETSSWCNVIVSFKHVDVKVSNVLCKVDAHVLVTKEVDVSTKKNRTAIYLPPGAAAASATLYIENIAFTSTGTVSNYNRYEANEDAYQKLAGKTTSNHTEIRYQTAIVKDLIIANGTVSEFPKGAGYYARNVEGTSLNDWKDSWTLDELRMSTINKDQKPGTDGEYQEPARYTPASESTGGSAKVGLPGEEGLNEFSESTP